MLIATDVLSEGQNLQDCAIVVNYDLPWAIIRLIQRAGRVDRIGQSADEILCHSFLPADGVERIITLRKRVRERLKENAEVVGADEAFFEDEADDQTILNLYHEQAGILDGDADGEVDLASHAYQIWKNAIDRDPRMEKTVATLPDVVFSSREHAPTTQRPEGVLVFMRSQDGNHALAYVGQDGKSITESQLEILSAAQCEPHEPAWPHHESHHQLVAMGSGTSSPRKNASAASWGGPPVRGSAPTPGSRRMRTRYGGNYSTSLSCTAPWTTYTGFPAPIGRRCPEPAVT